ncbi:UNVERIFIED_CONTAM: hypothetical protein FKN15_050790 [Acipenser sinensis]
MWRRPEEWGKIIYQWVSKNGMTNSVFTLYELSNGDDTENEEFHGLEDWMLLRSLQALQLERKAEIITLDDSKGNLEWIDKNKTRCLIMWRRPEEWGKIIYQWVSKNGMTNSVFTLYELSNGDDTENEEFHGLEDWMLLRSLQALQLERKAEIITLDDSKGVKFF